MAQENMNKEAMISKMNEMKANAFKAFKDNQNPQLAALQQQMKGFKESEYYKNMEAKKRLTKRINAYDKSDKVNQFYINGVGLWLSREERQTILRRCDAEEHKGLETVTLHKDGMSFDLPIALCRSMVLDVEFYASRCWDNTQVHKEEAKKLTTKAECEAYDYRVGYPEKCRFEV